MPLDPVCGMEVSEDVEFKTEYQGTTYYFCAHHCLEEFKKDPSKYV